MDGRVVGNDVGDQKNLVILGSAQLMLQCGMFVPAESFCASVSRGVFTHFKREEDATMQSGKLDEKLGRMTSIVDKITADSIVLLNESFATTNEREDMTAAPNRLAQ